MSGSAAIRQAVLADLDALAPLFDQDCCGSWWNALALFHPTVLDQQAMNKL